MDEFISMDGFIPMGDQIIPENIGEKHIACVLLVDISGSMGGAPITELNEALAKFGEVLRNDARASGCADVCIIAFNHQVNVVVPFCPAVEYTAPVLQASGSTAMNEAIITGLDLLENRKELYRRCGTPYYRPWMFLMTDGEPTDHAYENDAKQRLSEAITAKKVTFFPMGIGSGARTDVLKSYNNDGMVLKADASHFAEAFVWLSSSMAITANSRPGTEKIKLAQPPTEIEIEL